MAETDLTPEEAAADDRLPQYNTGAYDPVTNEFGFDEDGHQVNQMRQARDAGVMGRLARRLAIFVQGLANTVAANVLLTAEDAENTRLDRIATAENVVKAAEEVTKAGAQAERLAGTSATNVTPGVGSRTFTTQAGKYFAVGTFLTVVSTAAPTTRWMAGQVTAYNATTGALTVNVEAIGATTSAAASWSIYLGGPRGAQGIQGIPGIATMPYLARSANTQLVAGDSASLIDATGTFTQTFAAPATLAANWYCFYKNAGTGNITIPASDGRTNWIMYPGEMRLFQCDGTTLRSEVLWPFSVLFTASGTFNPPPGYLFFRAHLLSGAGGGAGGGYGSSNNAVAGSGSGASGTYRETSLILAAGVSNPSPVSVGSGGGAGANGASSGLVGSNGNQGGASSAFGFTASGGLPGQALTSATAPGPGGAVNSDPSDFSVLRGSIAGKTGGSVTASGTVAEPPAEGGRAGGSASLFGAESVGGTSGQSRNQTGPANPPQPTAGSAGRVRIEGVL